jgi:two-component system OmpR family sensor kinase
VNSAPRVALRGVGKLRSRLALRIYLVGLVQFFLVAVGMLVAATEARREAPSPETLRVVADSIAASPDDLVAVTAAVQNAERLLHTSLAVYDDAHQLIAGTPRVGGRGFPPASLRNGFPPGASEPFDPGQPPPPPRGAMGHAEHSPPPFPTWDHGALPFHDGPLGVRFTLHDGRVWHLVVTSQGPIPSALRGVGTIVILVLIVVGVSAWLTARSLARPLARLSAATHAFGAGDLDARADLRRNDELGEVADAFDQMAERVTAALRAEKELLANVSHELRTPLQRIHIAIDLAAEGDADTARESLGEIAEDLAELERIVEDVLSAARLSLRAGRGEASALPPIHVGPVDLVALVEKSVSRFRSMHPARTLRVEQSGPSPALDGDAVLLRRTLDNLLDNADKYTDDAAEPISLVLAGEESRVVIEVCDQGIGIDAVDVARLFEPFFRADRSRHRGSGGLGLGLALAKRIVEAHRGTLTIASTLGKGTTARIELPCGAPVSV